ncbi:MAG: NifU family protein [Holosporaceae bacterium]|jgi:Fe-S cluster biogenesis protein NfuA|nr:NifU family protein [Holosporaceae bacterium]
MITNQGLFQKIKDVVDSVIRPSLNMDGGDIAVISLDGHILSVKLQGACASCPRAANTLKLGVERTLRQRVSEDIVVNAV